MRARRAPRRAAGRRSPASRSTPARVEPGEAFVAIKGDIRDGHDFVAAALQAGAGARWSPSDKRDAFAEDAPLLIVPDVLDGLRALARAARARSQRQGHRRHRLGRQDRDQGGARGSRSRATGQTHARSSPSTITGACR